VRISQTKSETITLQKDLKDHLTMAYKDIFTRITHLIVTIGPEYLSIVNKILIDCLCDVLSKVHTKHLMKT